MARRSHRRSNTYSNTSQTRVTSDNANSPLLRFDYFPTQLELFPLVDFEDRRTFHPDPNRPAASFNKPRHRLKVSSPTRYQHSLKKSYQSYVKIVSPSPHVGFRDPRNVLICVRRKMRKEVLHAFRKTGKGGQRRPRYSDYSSIRC